MFLSFYKDKERWYRIRFFVSNAVSIIASVYILSAWILLCIIWFFFDASYGSGLLGMVAQIIYGIVMPALVAFYAIIKEEKALLLFVFIWSFPFCLYAYIFPAILGKLFLLASLSYLTATIIMPGSLNNTTNERSMKIDWKLVFLGQEKVIWFKNKSFFSSCVGFFLQCAH